MMEIERKFLLRAPAARIIADAGPLAAPEMLIEQRYLSDTGKWTIRCRQVECSGQTRWFVTMKRSQTDVSCHELETEVSQAFHDQMAALCGPPLRKLRTPLTIGDATWEIDLFLDFALSGLELAEIELASEDAPFERPAWLGREVTQFKDFKNKALARRIDYGLPFLGWRDAGLA